VHRLLRRILGLLVLATASGAVAAEPPAIESVWPLFYRARSAERTDFEGLGPLLYYQRGPEGTTYGARPLFCVGHDVAADRHTLQILYPLATFRREKDARRAFVFPFYFHERYTAPNGRRAGATAFFPFLWWGQSAKGRSWISSPFLGGTFHGLLGSDEFTYAAMLYVRLRMGDTVHQHILPPLFSWSRGPGHRGLRIFPFFGRTEREGQWRNGYIFWPFFTYGSREDTKQKKGADYVCSWPFFGRSSSRDGRSGSLLVLWPFYYRGWNEHKNQREWSAPFPFFFGKHSDELDEVNVWPFFSRTKTQATSQTSLLAGIVRSARVRTKNTSIDTLSVYPLFGSARTEDRRRASKHSFWMVWPLARARSRQEGTQTWGDANAFQFAWMKFPEDFDRNYNALMGLFEHARARDGRRATFLFWRLFRSEGGPGWSHVQLGPFASWQRAPGLTRASFLLGLFQTGKQEGRRGWRIFHVPFGAPLTPPGKRPSEGEPRAR